MSEETSLEGWAPEVTGAAGLAEIIDRAFDYRGDVTIVRGDGSELEGYLFNRDGEAARPYVQVFGRDGSGPHTLLYAEIRSIRFTGKDTAAGNSYAAWLRMREAAGTLQA